MASSDWDAAVKDRTAVMLGVQTLGLPRDQSRSYVRSYLYIVITYIYTCPHYISVCPHMCICVYVHVVYVHMYSYMFTYIDIGRCVHICIRICTCIRTFSIWLARSLN